MNRLYKNFEREFHGFTIKKCHADGFYGYVYNHELGAMLPVVITDIYNINYHPYLAATTWFKINNEWKCYQYTLDELEDELKIDSNIVTMLWASILENFEIEDDESYYDELFNEIYG